MSDVSFYNDKYAEEGTAPPRDVGERPRRPYDRFTACRNIFPTLFRGGSLLELGAGAGTVAAMLLRDGLEFDRYLATEFSEPRLALLRRQLEPHGIEVAYANAETLMPEIGVFDAVLMVAVIEHLVDPMAVMATIRRLLRPGGFVWIDTPNIAKWTRRLKLLAGHFPSTSTVNEGLTTYEGTPAASYDEGPFTISPSGRSSGCCWITAALRESSGMLTPSGEQAR